MQLDRDTCKPIFSLFLASIIECFVVATKPTMPLFKVLDNLTTQKKAVMANTIQELITKGNIYVFFCKLLF